MKEIDFNEELEEEFNKAQENFIKTKYKENKSEDINQIVEEQLKEIVTSDFHWIKFGEEQIRLFKSLSNKRIEGETFGEYKVRQKINSKMLKMYKKGTK